MLKGLIKFFLLYFVVVLIHSCKTDTEPEKKDYEKVHEISIETAQTIFTLMGQPQLFSDVKYQVDVYIFNYPMSYKGKQITASGLVCVPISTGESFPVISFQHGTITAHTEAPSVDYMNLQNLAVESIAGMGYVVIIPDEIGFGASSDYFHPFLIKASNVQSVTDMLSALREIPDGDLSGSTYNDSLFLMGYSHGGWVTMATLKQMESTSQTSWNLIAAACGAGPYFPERVMNYALSLDYYGKPYYLSYVMLSFLDEGLIDNPLTDFFNEPYAGRIPGLYDGINTGTQIDAQLTTKVADLFSADFLNNYPNEPYSKLQQALISNGVTAWMNKTPLMLMHGQNDIYIPKTVSDSIYIDFLDAGSQNIEYQVIPLSDHITAAAPAISSAIIWFNNFR